MKTSETNNFIVVLYHSGAKVLLQRNLKSLLLRFRTFEMRGLVAATRIGTQLHLQLKGSNIESANQLLGRGLTHDFSHPLAPLCVAPQPRFKYARFLKWHRVLTAGRSKWKGARMQVDILLKKLAKPAQRAIQSAGVTTLKQSATFREREILEPHGLGKNSVSILNSFMKENGLSFKDQK